jgi:hypothetical protein
VGTRLPCPDALESVTQLYDENARLKRLARRVTGYRHVSAATDSDHESVTCLRPTATGLSAGREFGHVGAGTAVYNAVYNTGRRDRFAGLAGDAAAGRVALAVRFLPSDRKEKSSYYRVAICP